MHPPEHPEASDESGSPLESTESGPKSYFNGRVALVTGGGRGIGALVAEMIAVCGGRVIVADLDGDRAKAVASAIDGQAVALDVADPPSWDSVNLETPPTIAFLNAAVPSRLSVPYDIHEVTRAEVTRTIGANFLGVLHGLRRLTPAMAAAGDARICLNASMAGLIPIEMDPLFAATKHAVVGLGRSIAGPLSAQGVRVTLLCAMVPDSPNVPDSIRPVLEQAFGPLLEPRRVAQAALDLLEFGASGEIRVVTPERYSRARIRIEFEDVEPAAAYDE